MFNGRKSREISLVDRENSVISLSTSNHLRCVVTKSSLTRLFQLTGRQHMGDVSVNAHLELFWHKFDFPCHLLPSLLLLLC